MEQVRHPKLEPGYCEWGSTGCGSTRPLGELARPTVVLVAGRKDGEVADGYTGLKRTIWGTVFLGLGLGGFFDGIVLHQILQWHHMMSQVEPVTTVAGLKINTLADGLFHGATYLFTLLGIWLVWSDPRPLHLRLATRLLIGGVLAGWGLFNLLEGIVDHEILGIHHVNETVPQSQWLYWDVGFLVWGAIMLIGGLMLLRAGDREVRVKAAAGESERRTRSSLAG